MACLTQIHRCQAFAIPYDTLDIQLRRAHDRDAARIFDKTVTRRRGGWCYELHALLHWALLEAGFSARVVTAGIHREQFGDAKMGNHTAILVDLDEGAYLADLGLGDGIRDPIPVREGVYRQGRLTFSLELVDDGYWRFRNHAFAYPTNFDFRDESLDESLDEALVARGRRRSCPAMTRSTSTTSSGRACVRSRTVNPRDPS